MSVSDETYNELSRLHGEMFKLAQSFRDTACRTLDKAEIYAKSGKPLPADEISAMTERIRIDTEKLYGPGRPVRPHATGPATFIEQPPTAITRTREGN